MTRAKNSFTSDKSGFKRYLACEPSIISATVGYEQDRGGIKSKHKLSHVYKSRPYSWQLHRHYNNVRILSTPRIPSILS